MSYPRLTHREVHIAAAIALFFWGIGHLFFVEWLGIGSMEAVLAANAATALAVLAIAWFALGIFAIRVGRVAFLAVLFIWLFGAIFGATFFEIRSGCMGLDCLSRIAPSIALFPFTTLLMVSFSGSWIALLLVSAGIPVMAFLRRSHPPQGST